MTSPSCSTPSSPPPGSPRSPPPVKVATVQKQSHETRCVKPATCLSKRASQRFVESRAEKTDVRRGNNGGHDLAECNESDESFVHYSTCKNRCCTYTDHPDVVIKAPSKYGRQQQRAHTRDPKQHNKRTEDPMPQTPAKRATRRKDTMITRAYVHTWIPHSVPMTILSASALRFLRVLSLPSWTMRPNRFTSTLPPLLITPSSTKLPAMLPTCLFVCFTCVKEVSFCLTHW